MLHKTSSDSLDVGETSSPIIALWFYITISHIILVRYDLFIVLPAFIFLISSGLFAVVALAYPQFPTYYKANVTVTLPYADFVEPIFVYYDGDAKKARFDYCILCKNE